MRGSVIALLLGAILGLPYAAFAGTMASSAAANRDYASVTGTVTASNHEALPGAVVKVIPTGQTAATDAHGTYMLARVKPGVYTLRVSYVGFQPYSKLITLTAGKQLSVNVVMDVASVSQQVIVKATQVQGLAEAINEERSSLHILDVLPAKVITSLPNANIADAVGRLPGVTLERDEGEGKYVQIRGTEPRLSNLTIDGIEVPSPEGGVRQVKLDTIPADIVQSVQIYKTLEADQPGDAIGGSVNIVTKTAGDRPTFNVSGLGGFTPIENTVPVGQMAATVGRRFGASKRFGVMLSGSWDYNGRGIDDIEPIPAVQAGPPDFTDMDVRAYQYDRRRYGFAGDLEYRVHHNTHVYLRGLFSEFKDYGDRYDYAIATVQSSNMPSFYTERRLGDFQVADLILGGSHYGQLWNYSWEVSAARSRMGNPINGGEDIDSFNYVPSANTCTYNAAGTTDKWLPQFSQSCFSEVYNPSNLSLNDISDTNHGLAAQVNLQAMVDVGRNYSIGKHPSIFKAGFWMTNAHKFDDSYQVDYLPNNTLLASQFVDNYHNSNYYNGAYRIGPGISWYGIGDYFKAHRTDFTVNPDPTMTTAPPVAGGNSNNFDLVERIPAGYVMNTLDLGWGTLYAGVRIEGTQDNTVSYTPTGPNPGLTQKGKNSYVQALPSASLTVKLPKNSDIRFVYGRGISRPDPQFLTTATSVDQSTFPPTVTIGNPALNPETANDVDVLFEKFLQPLGAIRAGFFYKNLNSPIVNILSGPKPVTGCPQANCYVSQASNAGSAYIAGLELSFEQHFTYLPGLLGGLGLNANYSYTTSQATDVNPGNRTDKPALLRQAPNTWNISPTYDRGRLSVRGGISYNGPNIYQYQYTDGTPGGLKGPGGDLYLFAHLQADAQASFRVKKRWSVIFQGLNLNNEVFGFYQGSPQYFIQREYYQPTYTFGFRFHLNQ
jgi:TonB-dependent receptor